eukprot:TRINITY_DN10502_c1_g1_i1.p1 TRINITY_DN10502_c1_g1~~TRINITY_DN10502_c1_g1_i1.p1  ORF type:complete len:219 (+),score=17.57 TRINITY_DN10502_c1_g1_i1:263-919(+)
MREGTKNTFRIGAYSPVLNSLHDRNDGPAPIFKRMVAGAISGTLAALLCNPIELAKTRLQAEATGILVQRKQFGYKGVFDCFCRMTKEEGISGMWKGTTVSILRSATHTSVNLTFYTLIKEMFEKHGFPENPLIHCTSSMIAAFLAVLSSNPLDVLRSRLYNQKDTLYKGAWDCAKKVTAVEGLSAWYKGFWMHYFRVGPHYILTFAILERMKIILHP